MKKFKLLFLIFLFLIFSIKKITFSTNNSASKNQNILYSNQLKIIQWIWKNLENFLKENQNANYSQVYQKIEYLINDTSSIPNVQNIFNPTLQIIFLNSLKNYFLQNLNPINLILSYLNIQGNQNYNVINEITNNPSIQVQITNTLGFNFNELQKILKYNNYYNQNEINSIFKKKIEFFIKKYKSNQNQNKKEETVFSQTNKENISDPSNYLEKAIFKSWKHLRKFVNISESQKSIALSNFLENNFYDFYNTDNYNKIFEYSLNQLEDLLIKNKTKLESKALNLTSAQLLKKIEQLTQIMNLILNPLLDISAIFYKGLFSNNINTNKLSNHLIFDSTSLILTIFSQYGLNFSSDQNSIQLLSSNILNSLKNEYNFYKFIFFVKYSVNLVYAYYKYLTSFNNSFYSSDGVNFTQKNPNLFTNIYTPFLNNNVSNQGALTIQFMTNQAINTTLNNINLSNLEDQELLNNFYFAMLNADILIENDISSGAIINPVNNFLNSGTNIFASFDKLRLIYININYLKSYN